MDSGWLGRLRARPKFPADGLLVVGAQTFDDDCFLCKARFSDGIDVVMGLIDDLRLPCNGNTIAVTYTGVARTGAPIFTARGLTGRTLKATPPRVAQSTAAEDELVDLLAATGTPMASLAPEHNASPPPRDMSPRPAPPPRDALALVARGRARRVRSPVVAFEEEPLSPLPPPREFLLEADGELFAAFLSEHDPAEFAGLGYAHDVEAAGMDAAACEAPAEVVATARVFAPAPGTTPFSEIMDTTTTFHVHCSFGHTAAKPSGLRTPCNRARAPSCG
jgi:hypothetical protein